MLAASDILIDDDRQTGGDAFPHRSRIRGAIPGIYRDSGSSEQVYNVSLIPLAGSYFGANQVKQGAVDRVQMSGHLGTPNRIEQQVMALARIGTGQINEITFRAAFRRTDFRGIHYRNVQHRAGVESVGGVYQETLGVEVAADGLAVTQSRHAD